MSEKNIHDETTCNYLKDKAKLKDKHSDLNDNQEYLLSELQEISSQLLVNNNYLLSKIEKDEEQDKEIKKIIENFQELTNNFHSYKLLNNDKLEEIIKKLENNNIYIRGINQDTKHMQNGYMKELAKTYKDEMAPTTIRQEEKLQKLENRIEKLIDIISAQNEKEKTIAEKDTIEEKNKGKKQSNIKEVLKIVGWIILIIAVIAGIDIPG